MVWLLLPNGNPPGIGIEVEIESSVLDGNIVPLPSIDKNGSSRKSEQKMKVQNMIGHFMHMIIISLRSW